MVISDIRIVQTMDCCELHASVKLDTHWVWGDEPFPLWYRFPRAYRPYLSAENGDPFVPVGLAPAMVLGEPLEIRAPVSPRLLQALPEIQSIYRCWNKTLAEVPVAAPSRQSGEREAARGRHAGLFFSMGVDSSYSLWRNVRRHPAGDRAITHLITVHGFDIYLWDTKRYPPLLASVDTVAKELGKSVLPVATNLRELSDRIVPWPRLYFGAALSSIALALGGFFVSSRISAAQTYAALVPEGAHPLLDPLWSTEDLSFVHDGLEATRLAKCRSIAGCPVLVANLRVCTTGEVTDAYNCGRCEKCLRTMIGLHVAGVLRQCRTLPHEIDLSLVRSIHLRHEFARHYLEELVEELGSRDEDLAIRAALEECLARNQGGQLSGTWE